MSSIDIVTWGNAHFYGDALAQSYQVRHRAFIEKQNWDVPHCYGMEYDTYDTPAAVYLLARNEFGRVLGLSRLIPTIRPYMLDEIWPHMLGQRVGAHEDDVWEATRFAVDPDLDTKSRQGVAIAITLACLEFGVANGIKSYFVLSPLAILRRVIGKGGAGCAYTPLGAQEVFGHTRVSAAEVAVDEQTLFQARLKTSMKPLISKRSMELYQVNRDLQKFQNAA
jgi:acyl homoserine lactone synthase